MSAPRKSSTQTSFLDELSGGLEEFTATSTDVTRVIKRRDGSVVTTALPVPESTSARCLAEKYDIAWLRQRDKRRVSSGRSVTVADLFSGCGGLSLGMQEAARAVGYDAQFRLAADMEQTFLEVYETNFRPTRVENRPIEMFVNGALGARASSSERDLQKLLRNLNILVAGPPCQGHSDLNNYTRRADPKNSLYERVARVAELVAPEHVIIENVLGVRHDKSRVMQRTIEALQRLGYNVDVAEVQGDEIGVPQRRRRVFVVASLTDVVEEGGLSKTLDAMSVGTRPISWAIEDLLNCVGSTPFDETSVLSEESKRRVDWLFDNNEFDLPDEFRPYCHSHKTHTYKSVYGRMYWDRPAQTITTGFQVMGQGRFLHALQRRVITPHEAARIQFFPDHFDFGIRIRRWYAKMIGNAVPPKMGYVVGLHLLR